MILRPRFLALDTSHITQWVRDHTSSKSGDREASAAFSQWLEDKGGVPLLTLHHIAELCGHGDTALVRDRIRFLHGLKMVAWIGAESSSSVGGVTSILSAEVLAAYQNPALDVIGVRDATRTNLIRFGTGQSLLGPDPDLWLQLVPYFIADLEKDRELVALTHTDLISISDTPMSKLLNGQLRSGESLKLQFRLIRGSIKADIAKRGDRRIADPGDVADRFMDDVEETAASLSGNARDRVLAGLAMQGVEPQDIGPKSTLGEMLDLGTFLSQMRVVTKSSGVPFETLKALVNMKNVPSWKISQSVRAYLPKTKERKGSEINDLFLACLAPYADVTFVDARTDEAFKPARLRSRVFDRLCNRVSRAETYRDIPAIVGPQLDQ